MTKQEFLEKLRLALNGRVSPAQLMENLSYYEDYINTEIRKGKGEEEVLAGLENMPDFYGTLVLFYFCS